MKATTVSPARPRPGWSPELTSSAIEARSGRPFKRVTFGFVAVVLAAAIGVTIAPRIASDGSANLETSTGRLESWPSPSRSWPERGRQLDEGASAEPFSSRSDRRPLVVAGGRSARVRTNRQAATTAPTVSSSSNSETSGSARSAMGFLRGEVTTTTSNQPTTAGSVRDDSANPSTSRGVRSTSSSSSTTARATTTSNRATTATRGATTSTSRATTTRRSTTTAAPTTTTAPTTSIPATTAGGSGQLVWEEHFNSLDTGRWEIEHSTYGDGNNELQCYRPENVRVASGRLVLTAKSERYTCPSNRTRNVTSGMVRSRGLSFSPGQAIEFRVKLTPPDRTNQGGLWPAVWASSWAPGGWPRGGELDWLEVMTAEDPRRSVFSMHYADRSGRHELQNKAVPMGSYFSDAWHVVRFEYGHHGELTWYLDGRQVFHVDHADTVQGYPAPFNQTISEIKINLAVGGTPGPLAPGALGSSGATFEVDYIRVVTM